MQRVRLRRFVLVAALAVLAGAGLAGCQSQPGTAGYVGHTRFTDAEVESTVTKVQADVDKTQPGSQFPTGNLRTYLVQRMVLNELTRQYALEQNITVPAPDYKTAADTIGLPEDDPVVRLSAEEDAFRTALLAKAKPVAPTEAQIRDIYDKITAQAGDIGPYDQAKASIVGLASLAPALGLRAALLDAEKRYGVGVNPRYGPAELPLYSVGQSPSVDIVTLPLGQPAGSPAVSDLPSPAPAA